MKNSISEPTPHPAPRKKRGRKPKGRREVYCEICEKMYSSVSKYNRHYKENHAKNIQRYRCKECSKTFKRKSHLNRHIKALHLNQKLQCPLCVSRYMEKRALTCHLKNKHASYRCLKCGVVLPLSEKDRHRCDTKSIRSSWKNKKTCPICSKTYQRYGYLKKHLINVHCKSYESYEEKVAAKKILEKNLDPSEQLEQFNNLNDEEDIDLIKDGDIDEDKLLNEIREYGEIEVSISFLNLFRRRITVMRKLRILRRMILLLSRMKWWIYFLEKLI